MAAVNEMNQPEACFVARKQQASDRRVKEPVGHTLAAFSASLPKMVRSASVRWASDSPPSDF